MADEIKVIDGEINRTLSDLSAAAQQFQPLFPFHVGSGQELEVLDELNQLNQQLQTPLNNVHILYKAIKNNLSTSIDSAFK
ncbi:DUF5344 family protein [Priestia aryabhattai]|uniref:DUF5344 family protein n=1 Tax=Priestia aryabhattai TaxID=412384 RepID=UPI001CC0C884|nr:DUF5344 family protein [Priestia aryabhattai]